MKTVTNLSQLIKKNKFDYINSNITDSLFPAPIELRTDYKLFHFDKNLSFDDAVKEMQKEGYEPANIYELLSWNKWNGKDWIVALGSVVKVGDGRSVPCLGEGDSGRSLHLPWWGGGWGARYRFLAVRNLSSDVPLDLESRVQALEKEIESLRKFLIF